MPLQNEPFEHKRVFLPILPSGGDILQLADVSIFSSLYSLYPYIALKKKFVVGAGIHLLGEKKLALLTLDYGQGCFVYRDPLQGTLQECDGIIRCQIGVD